jgi:hypothetical protein
MSSKQSAKKAQAPLRVVHGNGNPTAAGLEEIAGVVETMRVARKNGIDLRVQLHVGSTRVDISNTEEVFSAGAGVVDGKGLQNQPRFVNLDANCKPVAIGKDHVAVYDSLQDLIFTAAKLPGEASHEESLKKAAAHRLFGRTDWRAPTVRERFAIADLTRRDPAINTDHFRKESGWEWTSDVLVNSDGSPSDYAWFVSLDYGGVFYDSRGDHYGVRAVCPGQQLALSL